LSKKPDLFRWQLNPKTGQYQIVPVVISANEFWDTYAKYEAREADYANDIYTHYDLGILDAIDQAVDSMERYPEAERILNLVKRTLDRDDEN